MTFLSFHLHLYRLKNIYLSHCLLWLGITTAANEGVTDFLFQSIMAASLTFVRVPSVCFFSFLQQKHRAVRCIASQLIHFSILPSTYIGNGILNSSGLCLFHYKFRRIYPCQQLLHNRISPWHSLSSPSLLP